MSNSGHAHPKARRRPVGSAGPAATGRETGSPKCLFADVITHTHSNTMLASKASSIQALDDGTVVPAGDRALESSSGNFADTAFVTGRVTGASQSIARYSAVRAPIADALAYEILATESRLGRLT